MENKKAVDPVEDVDDSEVEIEERVCQVNNILDQIGIQHPIIYDVYDLCQYYKNDKLRLFNVSMLKSICEHFEIPEGRNLGGGHIFIYSCSQTVKTIDFKI